MASLSPPAERMRSIASWALISSWRATNRVVITRPALDSGYISMWRSSCWRDSGSSLFTSGRRSSGSHSSSSKRSSSPSSRPRTSARRASSTASKIWGRSSGGSWRSVLAARCCRNSRSITRRISSGARSARRGPRSAGWMRASSRSARSLTPLASRRRRILVVETCGVAMTEGLAPREASGESGG
jgi:hypothetical protein